MKLFNKQILGVLIPLAGVIASCSKDKDNANENGVELQQAILKDVASNVCEASYIDMYDKAVDLQTAVTDLNTTTTTENLENARKAWLNVRVTWERSESWLFGPVEADNIDPRIDTWPVDFNDLNGVLETQTTFPDSYIDQLDDALKGFHPIEYILWGENGDKTAEQLTAKEKLYLTGLINNLVALTKDAKDTWVGGYTNQLRDQTSCIFAIGRWYAVYL